jgi:hypothetical protein
MQSFNSTWKDCLARLHQPESGTVGYPTLGHTSLQIFSLFIFIFENESKILKRFKPKSVYLPMTWEVGKFSC